MESKNSTLNLLLWVSVPLVCGVVGYVAWAPVAPPPLEIQVAADADLVVTGASTSSGPGLPSRMESSDIRADRAAGGERARPRSRRSIKQAKTPEVVVFIVIDTVRTDHMGFCGYERPNTPVMNSLRDDGAVWTCDAYAPAPWTLPSHASFFTGLTVPEHGAQLVVDSDIRISQHLQVRPLAEEYTTLAEYFLELDYQTAMISANPVIRKNSGLHQGFDRVLIASGAGGMDLSADDEHLFRRVLRGNNLAPDLERLLKGFDTKKPLFLFVNIFDAHVPYPEVPVGIPWLPPAPSIRFSPTDEDPENPFLQFTTGAMDQAEIPPFLTQLTDLYDYGIYQADKNVGRVLETLTEKGWLDDEYRLVITSDHGELLGEHDALRHGRFVYEPVVKVPVLFYESKSRNNVQLTAPFSAINTFSLVRDGRVPDNAAYAQAVSERNPNFIQPGVDAVAVWEGDEKLVWVKDQGTKLYNLVDDPAEQHPESADGHPLGERLEQMIGELETLDERGVDTIDMMEALQAVGYIE